MKRKNEDCGSDQKERTGLDKEDTSDEKNARDEKDEKDEKDLRASELHILTKYECARIIGVRASQLSMSAPILVSVPPHLSSNFMYIATRELIEKMLDIYVHRPLPLNKFYSVHVKEMMLPDDIYDLESMLNIA